MTDADNSEQGGAVLALDAVCLTRGDRQVLRDVTLHSRARRIGIVGRNGSGKTTLARVISGLVPVDSGTLKVCGVDVVRDRKAALRTVGILFQNPDHQIIFPTVHEELSFGLTQMGQSKTEAARRVAVILSDFGKSHWADAATHSLSHGQKQLVCLMAVIAMAPRVVVLDEPFSGLDIVTRMQLGRYLSQIAAVVVHVSHDPASLQDYDHVVWLDAGQIVQQGPAQDVLAAYVTQMTALGAGDDLSDLAG
ncbi:MAG: biotin transport system ATP-binding protein [Loktanella salsilacus]|jgi:biotin transport system ATP-binding protein|uniref:energy-coupling factor ABC transporter ATP-binding protein n=1 Tax=Loktanella salsilacus TaxID=195913 RepID=UPI0020B67CFF|nr:ABC transporter ATP-binding protein [Loktanella salsilacus]UTH44079.1 ABC transporter ATP-binding protein [Loktanella salsilacus]